MNKTYEKKEKVFFGEKFLENAINLSELKEALIDVSSMRYLMRAIIAGIIITFGYVGYILIDGNFSTIGTEIINLKPLGHFFSGWFFGFCLIFIYYIKAELLTSNMMLFSVSKYYQKVNFKMMFKVLIYCYIGNLLGGLFVGLLLANTNIIIGNEPALEYMKHVLEVKQAYVTTTHGVYDLFIRAVFCNFFINLSMVIIYAGNVKDDLGKMFIMFGGVFFFMYLGLEHSVANSVFFALAGFTDLFNPGLNIEFNFFQSVGSVLIALLGNFVGGGMLIGTYYAFLNDKKKALK